MFNKIQTKIKQCSDQVLLYVSFLTLMLHTYLPAPLVAFAAVGGDMDSTQHRIVSKDINTISNLIWPLIYFVLASGIWLCIASITKACIIMGLHSDNPQAQSAAWKTFGRAIVLLMATGSFGLIYAVIMSLMSV